MSKTRFLLGKTSTAIFFRVALPLARPAIVAGSALVAYEVLGDYGVVSYLGISTFSVAIFQTWFGMYDLGSAMKLAAWMMAGLILLLGAERYLRFRRAYHASGRNGRTLARVRLRGVRSFAAAAYCSVVLAFAFAIPLIQLLAWAQLTYHEVFGPEFWQLIRHSLTVACLASALIMALAIIVSVVCRTLPDWSSQVLSKSITAGYSVPGPIIAIGVLAVFISMDKWLAPVYAFSGREEAPLLLSMSLLMLISGYVIRFMAIGFHSLEAGYEKTGKTFGEASRLLGNGMMQSFFKVDIHLLKGAILSGFALSFVEIVKELPLALVLRPFNFETLATKTYQFAGDERIQEASVLSLLLIAISMVSVILLYRIRIEKRSAS